MSAYKLSASASYAPSCEFTIKKARERLYNSWTEHHDHDLTFGDINNGLIKDLANLIQSAINEGRKDPVGDTLKVYVTNYARLFNEQSTGCAMKSPLARDRSKTQNKQHNPTEGIIPTKDINTIIFDLNQAIKRAV